MLKALELIGFKSFADKTRFEFPQGITVVVGPNGSGKSNIVDAIKWVLGEQSAKSLRGKDMSDVIFKGTSGSGARRPANSATATIVLDNSENQFPFDASEIHVSRRVYRSGESEYLINGEQSRLKDVKELFRGTGVGTDAYSLIEQGKVERLLQANPKDRRAIFEEAAGISRFKAKKIEAERRLARVEGNLARLADIVDEVGNRYRSVKSQASRAARYKELADRLKQLRMYVGRSDWLEFSEKISAIAAESAESESNKENLSLEIAELHESAERFESQLEAITQSFTQHQESVTRLREEIAQTESQIRLNETRLADLEKRGQQLEDQSERTRKRVTELESRINASDEEVQSAEIEYHDSHEQLKRLETELQAVNAQIDRWTSENESRRAEHGQLIGLIAQTGRQVSSFETQVENLTETRRRLGLTMDQLDASLREYQSDHERIQSESEQLKQQAESVDSSLAQSRHHHEQLSTELGAAKDQLAELNHQHIATSQRAEVIEELERSLEGVNAGAREILAASQSTSVGPVSEVVGLVADVISVNVQHAAIVDVALGELAQYVVVKGSQLAEQIAQDQIKLNGRVGLIQLDHPPTMGADPSVSLNGREGVIGRADRLVQVQPEFQGFVKQLLGGTWVIKSLQAALNLHRELEPDQPVRLVTIDGEIVEPDGTVIAGPKSLSIGLISRRSELRALKREIVRLDQQIQAQRTQIEALAREEKQAAADVQHHINQNGELAKELANRKAQSRSIQENLRKTSQQLKETQRELDETGQQFNRVNTEWLSSKDLLTTNELQVAALISAMESDDSLARQSQAERVRIEKESTSARVKLAKSEQVLEGIQSRIAQTRSEYDEQVVLRKELETQQHEDRQAVTAALELIETNTQRLSELNLQREEAADLLATIGQNRTDTDHQRRQVSLTLNERRDQLRAADERLHQARMRVDQIQMQRAQLAERMQEDYGIDISALRAELTDDSDEEMPPRDMIDKEIISLRKKLGDIGSVNLDALQELEELEARYNTMDTQYQDLAQAKETLEKIIRRIDADSRKLFVETLEAIRINFQKLFRQTFGGGNADLVLEEGVDPLEAGVEIVATPPGKSQFSNSLLSGGEKALTAVSLLMAIFQFRPSPFCVLDEVDAPFDEANIGRFIDVLKSFLGWTRFVIVTHSKKTMTAATTLYGITMQESGVSKRVSVRFEDVNDAGEISSEAAARNDEDAA